MKRTHRRAHLLLWSALVPVTVFMFFLSLYLKQPDPLVSDAALDLIQGEAE